jgi:hypothetical protein
MKHPLWLSWMVPNQPMERVSVYMFLLCDGAGISSVFTAKINTLLDALLFRKSRQPGKYLILSDILSSIGVLRS